MGSQTMEYVPEISVATATAEALLEIGMKYCTGHEVSQNLVSAHKWFNLAAMKGNRDAVRLRQEIAAEMSESEIATAQRAARDWMRMGCAGARAAA